MKAVFCDLDETLLANWHVPEKNVQAIKRMRSLGHKFVPCSGRPPFMMTDILDEIGMNNLPGEYYICFNGGMLLEAYEKKVLYYNGLSYSDAAILLELAKKHQFSAMVVTNGCFHIFNPIQSEITRKTNQRMPFVLYDHYDLDAVDILKTESIGKVMFISDSGVELFKKTAADLPASITEHYEISFSSNRFMEFNKKGVSKGAALEFLANYLQIEIADTVAIGDSFNDISMIQKAGIGVCMPSGDPEVKELSDFIPEHDYMDGAVAEVLEKFVL